VKALKYRHRQTDRQRDATKTITTPHSGPVKIIRISKSKRTWRFHRPRQRSANPQ